MNILKLLNKNKQIPKAKTTLKASGNNKIDVFTGQGVRSRVKIESFQKIYTNGGVITQGIDCYPQMMLSQSTDGFTTVSEDESQADYIQSVINGQDFYNELYALILDAIVCGDGMAEIVRTREGMFHHLALRNPAYFSPHYDIRGDIDYYVYKIDAMKNEGVKIMPYNMLHIILKDGVNHDHFGLSTVGCAYDDILRDATISEAIKLGIERHGTPKYDVSVGTDDSMIEESDMGDVKKEFKNINARNEFVHTSDVAISQLDASGMSNVQEYNTVALERALTSMGVPLEMVGISSGSPNKATSDAVIKVFANRVTPLIKKLNSQLYRQLWLPELVKQFGEENVQPVYIDFGDITAMDMLTRVQVVKDLTSNTMNPFMIIDENEARDILGYQEREGFYDEVDEPEDEE